MRKFIIYGVLYVLTVLILVSVFVQHRASVRYVMLYFVLSLSLSVLAGGGMLKSIVYRMLITRWYALQLAQRSDQHGVTPHRADAPLVSVLIPAWNEEVGLFRTIKSVLANSYQPVEIVVINDGSTDNSDWMMHDFLATYEREMQSVHGYVPIIYKYRENGGKGSALNAGIALAHGEIIITTDADCVMSRDTITHFVAAFADPSVMCVVGHVKIGNVKTLMGSLQALEYAMNFYSKKADAMLGKIDIVCGAAGAFRREVFDLVGGYSNRHPTEDMEFSLRIRQAGLRIAYAPDAVIYTEGADTWRSLVQQRIRYKRGHFQELREQARFPLSRGPCYARLRSVIRREWIFVLHMLLTLSAYVYCILSYDFTIITLGIFGSCITSIFLLWEDKERRARLWLIPIVWALYHVLAAVNLYALTVTIYDLMRKREFQW